MKRTSHLAAAVTLVLLGTAAGAAAAPSSGASGSGSVYLATLVDSGHSLPRATSLPIRVRLDRFTADERVDDLVRLARRRGELALRRELQTESVGRLEIDGHLGVPIAYARRIEDADGAHLLLIAERSLSRRELFGQRTSARYPLIVVEIDLRPDGSGSGGFFAAARIFPRRDGEIELDGLNPLPARLMAVRTVS